MWVEELAKAVVAGGDVGRDQCGAALRLTDRDPELGLAERHARPGLDGVDLGKRRRLVDQRLLEQIERRRVALDLDHDSLAVVQDEAAEVLAACDSVDERAEADSLHDALDHESTALHGPT